MKKLIAYLVFGFILASNLNAQDFHFSQYWGSPVNLNPALSGLFDDNVRFAANYRNQWFQQATFTTYAVSVDANLWRNKLNGNFIGTGLGFYYDTESTGEFKNMGISLPISYTQKLGNNRKKHFLSLGILGSYYSKQINLQNLIFGNLFEINSNTDPIDFGAYNSKIIFDVGAGLNYFANFDNKHALNVGFSATHLAQPNVSFNGNGDDRLFRKFTAHASGKLQLKGDIVSIMPTLLFQKQGPHTELVFGSYVQFLLNTRSYTAFYVGGQYRLSAYEQKSFGSDAFILGARFEYEALDVGFAYDITVSDLRNAATFMGGPELYVIYTIRTQKSRYREFVNCPKF